MSVTLELVQNGKVLRSYQHEGKHFVEAPPEGAYTIRLKNNSFGKKLCVLSVDGRNVCDGSVAAFAGPGYVIASYQTINIPGWRRTSNEVAVFEFKPQEKSYAAKIGDGTSNTGVVGLAVFDEKEKPAPVHIHHHHLFPIAQPIIPWQPNPKFTWGSTFRRESSSRGFDSELENYSYNEIVEAVAGGVAASACSADALLSSESLTKTSGGLQTRSSTSCSSQSLGTKSVVEESSMLRSVEDLGTGYGQKQTMYTTETTFERASKDPSSVIQVQYAMRKRLIEWGVPVTKPSPSPSAFPAQPSPRIAVRAPDGWDG